MARRANVAGENLNDEMLRCRIYGHAWDEFYPVYDSPPSFGWRLSLRCTRCTTVRVDIIDRLGAVASRSYDYVDGYRDAEMPRPDRGMLRAALLERVQDRLRDSGSLGTMRQTAKAKAS